MNGRSTTRRLSPPKARALDGLLSARVAFELINRVPGLPETRERVATTRYLLRAIRATTARVIVGALRTGADASGTTVTLVARVPYRTDAGSRAHEEIHLSQLLYSGGRWWQSTDGQRWSPIADSETPAALTPRTAAPTGDPS